MIMSADKELITKITEASADLPVRFEFQCARIKTALDHFQESTVKLAILDLFLPDSTGLDALKTLKKVDETIKVILVSRLRTRSTLDRAFRHGAADVIIYPAQAETIRQVLLHRLSRMENEKLTLAQQQ